MVMQIFNLLDACIEHCHVVVVVVIFEVVVVVVLFRHIVVLIVIIEGDLICFELSRVEFLREFFVASVCFSFFVDDVKFLRRFVVGVG